MSSVLALAPRAPASPVLPASVQGGGKAIGAQYGTGGGQAAARLPLVDPAGFNDGVSLSRQSLSRTGELAASTVDVAQ